MGGVCNKNAVIGTKFEVHTGDLFDKHRFDARVTNYTNDHGVDVIVYDRSIDIEWAISCKTTHLFLGSKDLNNIKYGRVIILTQELTNYKQYCVDNNLRPLFYFGVIWKKEYLFKEAFYLYQVESFMNNKKNVAMNIGVNYIYKYGNDLMDVMKGHTNEVLCKGD